MKVKEEIIKDGFVVLKNVFTSNELENLRIAIEKVYNKVNEDPQNYTARYTSNNKELVDTWGVNNILNTGLYEEAFGEVFYNKKLVNSIKEVLGEELRFWGAHALWSPREVNYELRWHRDYGDNSYYEPLGIPNHLQFNIPLYFDDSFIAIPQSHKRKLTSIEEEQVEKSNSEYLSEQKQIECYPGDVLLMNAHTLHRGKCSTNQKRRTLHFSLQSKNEKYGGHTSFTEMRDLKYLNSMNSVVRELMKNLIEWDDKNPLSKREVMNKLMSKKEREGYIAAKQ